jgi:acyl-CoA thioesterase
MADSNDSKKPESVYRRDGDLFLPTGYARGPWHDETQHGGPMIALLGRAVEQHPSPHPVQVTRLTVDLMKAAPMAPVRVTTRVVRGGKNVEVLEASLLAGDEEMARASAMRVRLNELEVPADFDGQQHEMPPPLPADELAIDWAKRTDSLAFHQVCDIRPAPEVDDHILWFRFGLPLVEGEENSPFVRVAASADFTYSVPTFRQVYEDPHTLLQRPVIPINPDTTLNLHRPMEGEWLCFDVRTHFSNLGTATAVGRLFDQRGVIGYASQSLLVRGLESRPKSWKKYTG